MYSRMIRHQAVLAIENKTVRPCVTAFVLDNLVDTRGELIQIFRAGLLL
jgi:hypothetical protein